MESEKVDLDPPDWNLLKSLGNEVVNDMLDYLRNLRDSKVWIPMTSEIRANFLQSSPESGIKPSKIYDEVLKNVIKFGSGNVHPRFMGWVQGGGTPVGILGDIIASGMNMNCGGRDHVGIALEQQVVKWACEWFQFDPAFARGLFVTGSSMANLIGLLTAKDSLLHSLQQVRQLETHAEGAGRIRGFKVYTSEGAHKCVAQAVEMAGLDLMHIVADLNESSTIHDDGDGTRKLADRRSLRHVPVDGNFRMRLDLLEEFIKQDQENGYLPLMVIATAGTVDVGAVDDLEGVAAIARKTKIWMHIDGAYGALGVLSETVRPLLKGIEQADSIAFDFHKWGQVQYDAGMILVRRGDSLKRTFAGQAAAYLSREERGMLGGEFWPCDYGPDLSRGCRALKTWFVIKAYGTQGLGRVIDNSCALARALVDIVAVHSQGAESGGTGQGGEDGWSQLELMAPVALNIVCFRYHRRRGVSHTPLTSEALLDLNRLNREIVIRLHEQGLVAPSLTSLAADGQGSLKADVIRAALFNHRTTLSDVRCLTDAVLKIGDELTSTYCASTTTT